MPTPKKLWVQDGHVAQYPTALDAGGKLHHATCTDCHGGVDRVSDAETAHAGLKAIPGPEACARCHGENAGLAAGSLHTTGDGYRRALEARGVSLAAGSEPRARFDAQCTRCHVANEQRAAACGHCHVAVPRSAGGGLLAGHRFQAPSMDSGCTACHGSRVKDEYYGLNGALLARNLQYATAIPADGPWRGHTLQPDAHRIAGLACADCHEGGQMHGGGTVPGDDRYLDERAPRCTGCHPTTDVAFAAVGLHSPAHVAAMSCHVCHAQPYKSCFGCHTDVTEEGIAFFRGNETDPTRAARQGTLPALPAGDALVTFRAGRNPRFGPAEPEQRKYTVLRHVPVDARLFEYTGARAVVGLVPGLSARPTWKHATPHTIALRTPITSACANCHGADHAMFWLTDPVADSAGWVGTDAAAQAAEAAASAGAVQATPIPYSP